MEAIMNRMERLRKLEREVLELSVRWAAPQVDDCVRNQLYRRWKVKAQELHDLVLRKCRDCKAMLPLRKVVLCGRCEGSNTRKIA